MRKTLLRTVVIVGIWLVVAACSAEGGLEQNPSSPADMETSKATVEIRTPESTPTPEPTPTSEPTPTPEPTSAAESESQDTDSTPIIDITRPLPEGDPLNGEALVVAKACSGCHLIDAIGAGPSWKAENYANGVGIALRAQERWQKPEYKGQATNATEYLVESIQLPNAFVINGYMTGTMPQSFGELLTDQELADIVAYLLEIE